MTATQAAANTDPAAITPTKRSRRRILVALFVTGFGAFLNLYATQPLLPQFRQLFHASELLVSMTVSAPILAVALAGPWIGLMADSLGRKRIIVTSMLALSLPAALAATATTLPQLIAWRFLQGLLTPGIIAVAMAYVSEEIPSNWSGSAMSVYVTGGVVGGFSGRFVSGLIASRWGWQASMAVLALGSVAAGALTWWQLPASTKFVRRRITGDSLEPARAHLRNPRLLATYAVGFNVLFCLTAAFTYVNFYLADPPFSLSTAALAEIFAVYLIGAVITPFSGRWLDQAGARRVVTVAAFIGSVGALLTLLHWMPVVIAGLALAAIGAFASQSGASSYVGKIASQARSSAMGIYVAFYYLGGFAGSFLPGLFWKRAGWPGCVGLLLLIQSIIACVVHFAWHSPKDASQASAGN